MVTLPPEPADAAANAPLNLDDSQRAVVDLADDMSAVVVGAPGSGKTATLVELVAQRVHARGWSPEKITLLTDREYDYRYLVLATQRDGTA